MYLIVLWNISRPTVYDSHSRSQERHIERQALNRRDVLVKKALLFSQLAQFVACLVQISEGWFSFHQLKIDYINLECFVIFFRNSRQENQVRIAVKHWTLIHSVSNLVRIIVYFDWDFPVFLRFYRQLTNETRHSPLFQIYICCLRSSLHLLLSNP